MRWFALTALLVVAGCAAPPALGPEPPSDASGASSPVPSIPAAETTATAAPPTASVPVATAVATTPAATRALPGLPIAEAPSCPSFPVDHVLNADISALPIHPKSADWLASMSAATTRLHPEFGPPPFGYPFAVVDGSHPLVAVAFELAGSDRGPYPFSSDTPIEVPRDHHALMLNRDTCTLYELWHANWNDGRPSAGSGAVFDLRSDGLRPAGWTSADAAGLPIFPLLVRYDELRAGEIRHALRVTAVRTDRSYLWPARHQAGAAADPALPPMGARFRLRATFELSAFSRDAQVILRAMQRYGLILADNGANWFFEGTSDPRWTEALLDELKRVPASQFEAVDASALMVDPQSARARQLTN